MDGGGGRGGKEFFLSSHRCPEVDLLPGYIHSDLSCSCPAETKYLEVSSTCHSEEVEGLEMDEEEESISDWSEEDLSLHFSPSVIDPSDDEQSDPESGFECVDVSMETLVRHIHTHTHGLMHTHTLSSAAASLLVSLVTGESELAGHGSFWAMTLVQLQSIHLIFYNRSF